MRLRLRLVLGCRQPWTGLQSLDGRAFGAFLFLQRVCGVRHAENGTVQPLPREGPDSHRLPPFPQTKWLRNSFCLPGPPSASHVCLAGRLVGWVHRTLDRRGMSCHFESPALATRPSIWQPDSGRAVTTVSLRHVVACVFQWRKTRLFVGTPSGCIRRLRRICVFGKKQVLKTVFFLKLTAAFVLLYVAVISGCFIMVHLLFATPTWFWFFFWLFLVVSSWFLIEKTRKRGHSNSNVRPPPRAATPMFWSGPSAVVPAPGAVNGRSSSTPSQRALQPKSVPCLLVFLRS